MDRSLILKRTAAWTLLFALTASAVLPASALFRSRKSTSRQQPIAEKAASPNCGPILREQELYTYRDIALTGRLEASDPDGEPLTFQLTANPVRGSVRLSEEEPGVFVYTPYERKTGRDSFTVVAKDPAGNVSSEARIRIQIRKPDTPVLYADMWGHPAHKAAIRLAERRLYVGENLGGSYFFSPDRTVSRARFLTMAVSAAEPGQLSGSCLTGFHDDASIPAWAKPSVAAALRWGVVRGSRDQFGAPVFSPNQAVSCGEAAAMLDRLLCVPDAPAEVFSPNSRGHWASQAAANLSASGILSRSADSAALSAPLTMADAAILLDGALDSIDRNGCLTIGR